MLDIDLKSSLMHLQKSDTWKKIIGNAHGTLSKQDEGILRRNAVEFIILYMVYIYLPTPPLGQDMTQGQFLSGV